MHLSAASPVEGDPREPPVICTTTFTNPSYPKPRLFNKKLLTPLPWGQRSVLCQVNRCNISKELYRRNRIFLPKNIVAMQVKDGQLKGTEYKRNMKVVYRLFCRHFARTFSPTGQPFRRRERHSFPALENGGGATNPAGVHSGIQLRKCKSNPIPYPGLEINE